MLFIPWKESNTAINCPIRLKHNYKKNQFYFNYNYKPFFSVLNENCTTKFFIDALLKDSFEDAKVYISKEFNYNCDLDEISDIFKSGKTYKYLIDVSFDRYKKQKVNSILITDKEHKYSSIIHMYLIDEPDKYSKWKIFMIERE